MPDPAAFHANLQRGILLFEQDRFREAISFLQAAIAADPDNPRAYAVLAQCWNELPAERAKTIQAIDRAIGLAPNSSSYFGLKGWFFVCQGKFRAAQKTAEAGLAIDPACSQSLNSLANAYTKLGQWKKAEQACRRILELNPNDAPGLNLLAQALRHLGRWKESRAAGDHLLSLLPNNAFGQTNAGYGALAAGDHLRANEHFLNALRLNPHFDLARRGLLSSLRARIWILRWNIRIASLVASVAQRPATLFNLAATAGAFVVFIGAIVVVSTILDWIYPHTGLFLLGTLFLLVLLYLYLSGIIVLLGNFLLIFDPLGRHALTTQEKLKACIPALAFFWLIVLIIYAQAWILALILVVFLLFLAVSIQYPQMKDRWQRRREEQLEDQSPT